MDSCGWGHVQSPQGGRGSPSNRKKKTNWAKELERAIVGVNGVGTNSPFVATTEQVEVGAAVIAEVTARFGVPLYARVDLVRNDDGGYCVLEVEIVEPYLFLPEGGPAAVAAMVQAFTSG